MATLVHSKQTRLIVNDSAFAGVTTSLGAAWSQDLAERTVLDSEGYQWGPGLWSGTAAIGGYFDADGTELIRSVSDIADGLLITGATAGYGLGAPVYIANGTLSGHTIDTEATGTIPFAVEVESSDGPDWGVSLRDLTAATATANGSSVDQLAATTQGAVGVLQVTAASGTTPNLAVKLQHSVDNSVWVDLVTFTAATTTGWQRQRVTGTVNRYIRAIWTITGTTPSLTFTAALARR